MIGFWSVNAQNRMMNKEQERHLLQTVRPVAHHYDHLRNPNVNVLLDENFDNAALPTGWSVVDNSTGGAGPWTFVADYSNQTLDGTPFAMVNSDGYGQDITEDTELVTPTMDTSGLTVVFLSFDQYYNTYTGADTADVDVYDGTQWVNVFSTNSDIGAWGDPNHQSIDVSAYKNANFQVRFHYYNANWEWYWAVDNVMVYEPDANDLAVTDATPTVGLPNIPVALKAKVYNNGSASQDTFDVTFNVKDASNASVFNETVNVAGAALANSGTYEVASTAQPSFPVGTYTLEVTVALSGDANTANDTFSTPLPVIDFASTYNLNTVYSYNAFDGDTSGDLNNLMTFDIGTGAVSPQGVLSTSDFLSTGTFINDILVSVENGTNDIYLIDGSAGAAYKYGTFTGDIYNETNTSITGIAFDNTLHVGYVCTVDGFYTFDENFHTTLVGSMNNAGGMLGISVDNNGNVYGIDVSDDNLYSIDPATGAATVVGALGVDIGYAQDISVDPTTGNLYGTLFEITGNTGGLYAIDKASGAATAIGTPGSDEYTVCAIKGTTVSISENHIAGLKVYPNPTNGMILINAQENIQSIAIVNLAGQVVKTFDNNGLNAQLNISDLATGNYILKITTDQTVGSYQILKK